MNRFPGMVLFEDRAQTYFHEGVWTKETFVDVLSNNVQAYGDVEHRDEERTLSYQGLWREAESIAATLIDLGIRKGDKVAIQMPTSLDYVVALFGIARIGAVAVILQTDLGKQSLEMSLRQSESSVLFVSDNYRGEDLFETAQTLQREIVSLHTLIVRGTEVNKPHVLSFEKILDSRNVLTPKDEASNRPEATDAFMMVFTAGTTGSPKGVVHLHANTLWAARTYAKLYDLGPRDGMMDLAPIYHLTGMLVGITMPIATGGRMLLMDRFSGTRALGWIEKEKPRCLVGAPPHLIHLAESPMLLKRDTSSVRYFFYAGAPVPSRVLSKLQEDTGWTVGGLFGWSEGFLACATPKDDTPELISTTVGRLIPGMELKLVDEDGKTVSPGTPGEVICRGPSFAAGYYNQEQAAARKWDSDGWFHSGDKLVETDGGRYVYAGRVDDIINRGGTKIDPEVVEAALVNHPSILRAAVFGVPDKTLGARTVAAVISSDSTNPSLKEVHAFLESQGLAKFQLPDRLVILEISTDIDANRIGRQELKSLFHEQNS